ncbi:hypothetical protein VA249_19150 [Vibrio alfacsensis]|nr:hypothetical protein VA249_19150 [Vibrio alfacsensis]
MIYQAIGKFMLSLSIKNKILSLCSLSLVGFASVLYVGSTTLNDNTSQVTKIDKVYYPVMNSASLNVYLVNQLAERFNLAVTLGDTELLEANRSTYQKIISNFELQASLQPTLSNDIGILTDALKSYFDGSYLVAQGMIDGTISLQAAGQKAANNTNTLEKLTQTLDSFSTDRVNEFEASVSDLESENVQASQLMSTLGAMALLIISLVGWYVVRGIKKDLSLITDKMRDIAEGDGDLTVRLVHDKQDELKELVASFNSFVQKLQSNITHTIDNVGQLDMISTTLVSSSESTTQLSNQQYAAIGEVAESLNQLFDAARHIAVNASDASVSANSARDQAVLGEDQVKSTIAAVQELTIDVENASDVVKQLDSNTQSASSILDAISAIAEQTNLLALNAAIEAARAGEQGRGFAVVADEVRTLASRTQSSTQEIHNVLLQLQEQTKQASALITESAEKAQLCVEKSLVAEQSLKQITTDVAEISQRNEMIASATEEQEQTSARLGTYIDDIKSMAQGTADSVGQLDHVARDINGITSNLSQLTGHFKVS